MDSPVFLPVAHEPRLEALLTSLEPRLHRTRLVIALPLVAAIVGVGAALSPSELHLDLLLVMPVALAALAGPAAGVGAAVTAAATVSMVEHQMEAGSTAFALGSLAARVAGLLALVAVVHALLSGLRRAALLSWTDDLTGLPNRRAWRTRAEFELARMRRTGRPLTVVYLDIDGFKVINDTHGHATGDTVLRQMADLLRSRLRATDMAARIGGDEFVLLLPETGPPEVRGFLASLRQAFRDHVRALETPFTVSIGAATFSQAPPSVATLLRLSDEVMYDAKRTGDAASSDSA